MVTILEPWSNGMRRYAGLSTDTKPSDARNGDSFAEMDTGNVFMFDAENAEWHKQVSGGGGGGGGESHLAEDNDVNFIDYDGTIRYSYSSAQFANLSALPENPTHEGLIAQGWNWTLSDAKAQVASYGKLIIGQMYITDDGTTRLYCRFEKGCLSPYIGLCVNGEVEVDWGDRTSKDTLTGTSTTVKKQVQHSYQAAGDYIITLTVKSGNACVLGNTGGTSLLQKDSSSVTTNTSRPYSNAIKRIYMGKDIELQSYALRACYSLTTITIPKPSGSTTIGDYAFFHCSSLQSLILPSNVISIGESMAYACESLKTVSVPSSVTSIGEKAFDGCTALTDFSMPSGLTSIGSRAFASCSTLKTITIPNSVTSISENAFNSCTTLRAVTLPSNLTNIASYLFPSCKCLNVITIPSIVRSIGAHAFSSNDAMSAITIPSEVTSIGANAFNSCYGLAEIHFKPETPPAVSNANAFANVPSACIIYVPNGKLTAYTSAQNYPNPNNYTYVEESA